MPVFQFSGPDGQTHSIEGPDGATPEQAFQMLQQHLGTAAQPGVMSQLASAVTDIPSQIGGAAKEAISAIADAGPNSDANKARMEQMRTSSPFDISSSLQGVMNVGKAALGLPQLAASPITGAARSVIGHTYDALSPSFTPDQQARLQASGVNLPSGSQVADLSMMGMRPAGANPVGPTTKPAPTPTIDALKQSYKDVVNDPAIKSIAIPPGDVSNLSASVQNDLVQQGFRPTPKSAPDTFAELQRITPGDGVPSVGIDDLLAARRALGATAMERDQFGKATPDSAAAKNAMGALDNLLEQHVPQLTDANANYSAAKGAERLDYANAKAERRAAKSGAGMNLENTMRQEADKIPMRGLTPDQQAIHNQIVTGSPARNALRTVGKLGVDGGLSLTLNTMAAGATGGASIPVTAAATLARKLGEMLTRSQMAKLSNSIRSGTPLARSTPPTPIGAPNPLLGGVPVAQLPQMQSLLLRQLLGVMPSSANQQQQ